MGSNKDYERGRLVLLPQEAACGVLLAVAALKPAVTATEVRKVRDRFRSKHYCDRVLTACEKVEAGKAAEV